MSFPSSLLQCTYPFLVGMQLTGSEHICVHISLCALAEIFVFFKYLPVKVANRLELLIGGVLVAVNFVLDLACCGRGGNHPLDVEEVVAVSNVSGPYGS
jgi:hypothetical protein